MRVSVPFDENRFPEKQILVWSSIVSFMSHNGSSTWMMSQNKNWKAKSVRSFLLLGGIVKS